MKKIRFLTNARDKITKEKYKKGKEYEFENKRADEILATNKAVFVEEIIETAKKETETEKAVKKTRKKNKQ